MIPFRKVDDIEVPTAKISGERFNWVKLLVMAQQVAIDAQKLSANRIYADATAIALACPFWEMEDPGEHMRGQILAKVYDLMARLNELKKLTDNY